MTKVALVIAAALALPLATPSLAQAPAPVDVQSVQPLFGSWSYRPITNGTESAFTDATATQRLIIRCNRVARTVSIVRTGVPAAAPVLSIWTTSTARSVPARFDATRALTADLRSTDPLLDAIAFSRGRIATAAAGAAMVAVPLWPEAIRVIEDCRS